MIDEKLCWIESALSLKQQHESHITEQPVEETLNSKQKARDELINVQDELSEIEDTR